MGEWEGQIGEESGKNIGNIFCLRGHRRSEALSARLRLGRYGLGQGSI